MSKAMLAPECIALPETILSANAMFTQVPNVTICIKAVQYKILQALYIILFLKMIFYLYVCGGV